MWKRRESSKTLKTKEAMSAKPARESSGVSASAKSKSHRASVDDGLEHISDRKTERKLQERRVSSSMLPMSAASPTQPRSRASGSPTRRTSVADIDETMSLANSQKFNSTSTLFVDSTISAPNLEETLRCVALAIHYIIVDGHAQTSPNLFARHFDELQHPITDARVRKDYASRIPDERRIFALISKLFQAATLTAECGVIMLVYINRLIAYQELTLHASNWKRIILGSILMASKVWDDQAVWNVDFCTIVPKVTIEEMNELEKTLLEMLDFNIDVDSSVYAKYYFELRSLAEQADKSFPLKPLDTKTAAKLEAMSVKKNEFVQSSLLRHAQSLDPDNFMTKAVLS